MVSHDRLICHWQRDTAWFWREIEENPEVVAQIIYAKKLATARRKFYWFRLATGLQFEKFGPMVGTWYHEPIRMSSYDHSSRNDFLEELVIYLGWGDFLRGKLEAVATWCLNLVDAINVFIKFTVQISGVTKTEDANSNHYDGHVLFISFFKCWTFVPWMNIGVQKSFKKQI